MAAGVKSLTVLRPLKVSRWLMCGRDIHNRVWSQRNQLLLQGSPTVSNLGTNPPHSHLHIGAQSSSGKEKAKKVVEEEEENTASDVDLSRVCAGLNYFKTGEDPPIKEDSEYPAWLWDILQPVKSHKELSPDSKMYWRRLNKHKARENNLRSKQLGR